jgi:hypothetical protein
MTEVRAKKSLISEVGFLTKLIGNAITIDAVQPGPELIDKIEARVTATDADVRMPTQLTNDEMPEQRLNLLLRSHTPYFNYYAQLEKEVYVIHPMRMGAFLVRNAQSTISDKLVKGVLSIAYELPNGGLAWYYPRHFKVARMLGRRLKYSAISQGTLMAGLAAQAKANPDIDKGLSKAAFRALLWPYERGGVNLADRAVLEMPLFAGPPEIILNGWIDALLHTRDYAEAMHDDEAIAFFRRNIGFLVDILPLFDCRDAQISRYSDLSPYRAKISVARPEDVNTLEVLYRARIDGLPSIRVPLEKTHDPNNFSPYENQILRQSGRNAFVWLSCSQLYETIVVAKSTSLSAEINTGVLDRKQASPGIYGKVVKFESLEENGKRYFSFSSNREFFGGYPTNFAKNAVENFYHVYHIVALLLLAVGKHIQQTEREIFVGWALRWIEDMHFIEKNENLRFRDPQSMLELVNKNQIQATETDFKKLLRKVLSIRGSS